MKPFLSFSLFRLVPAVMLAMCMTCEAAVVISAIGNQTINEDNSTAAIPFSITGFSSRTPTVTGASSNTGLIPNSGIVIGGTGGARTVTVTPSANASGSSTITLTVTDPSGTDTETFVVTVLAVNDPPTVSEIPNQVISEDAPVGPLNFTIGDVESGTALTVTAVSLNTTLIPTGNIVLGGSGASRTISFTPALNQSGSGDILISVSDGALIAQERFSVLVNAVNDPPALGSIKDQTINEDSNTGLVGLSLSDPETPTSSLTLSASSSDTVLFPAGSITFPVGPTLGLIATPAANQFGTAIITVTASDGSLSTSKSFTIVVNSVNDVPTISTLPSQTVNEDAPAGPLSITIGDLETPVASLVMSGSSADGAVVPNSNIVFGGSGASRTVTITPAANAFGSSLITISVSDGVDSASFEFTLTVTAQNDAPVFVDIPNQTVNEDEVLGPVAYVVTDVESSASVIVTAVSDNQTIIPNANIVLTSSRTGRSFTITPAPNQHGPVTITFTGSDGSASTTESFVVTVVPVNDAPTISRLTDQVLNEDETRGPLALTLGDLDNTPESLVLSGASSNPTLFPPASFVFAGSGANRTLTLTPALNQFGSATITLTVSDGTASSSTAFTATVNAVNDLPTISNIADVSINEDSNTGPIAFTVGDAETAAASLTLSATSSSASLVPPGNVVFGGSGASRTVTVTPLPDQSGTTTITVTVSDGSVTASDSFVLTVNAINDPPTISNIADVSISEDSNTGPIAFTVGDTETAAASLTLSATSSSASLVPPGNIVFGGSGASRTVTVTPLPDQNGTSTITITVSDGSASASDSFVLTVNAINDLPTISNIADVSINEDANTGPIPFTVGDAETAAASLTLSATSSSATLVPPGNIVFGGSGASRTVTVTPASNQSGSATITVTVSDGSASASDSFVLTVNAVNDPPTISNIADVSISEDSNTGPIAFTVGDTETAAASLTLSATSSSASLVPPANIVFGGSGASRTVTVTPAPDQSGTAIITVTVSDGSASSSDSFVLTVNAVNDPPTISNIADVSISEDSGTGPIAFTVGDTETAVASLTLSATSSSASLVPPANIVFGGSGASRTVTVTPAPDQSGTAIITVTVSDGSASANDSFVLTVNAVNDPPTLSNIADVSISEDSNTGPIAFTVGDTETAAASLTLSATSSSASLVPPANIVFGGSGASRTVTITPVLDQSGTATITVTVSDGSASSSDSFVLTVNAVNDPPTISNIADSSINEDSNTGPIAFTVGDTETAAASLTLSATSSSATLVPPGSIVFGGSGTSRTITVTPVPNQSGSASITVTVSDGSASASDSFVLTVNAVNDPPTISNIADVSISEDSGTGPIAFTVGDTETAVASLTLSATSSSASLVPPGNIVFGGSGSSRTVTVTPASNQSGSTTITVTVSDGSAAASDSFLLTVNAVNDPPTISNIADVSISEDSGTGPIAFTVGDAETAAASLTLSAASSSASVVPPGNIVFGGSGASRTVTVTPALGASGVATITVTVSDGIASASDSFVVVVGAVNDLPTISSIADLSMNEDIPSGAVPFTIGDAETPAESLTLSFTSSSPSLFPAGSVVFGGSGASRTLTLIPAPHQFGSATITVSVSDGTTSSSETLLVTVNPINDPPTISSITDRSISEDSNTGAIPFTVGDIETPLDSLTITAVSSSPTLFPPANLVLGGSGASRTLSATPVSNQSGSATITITVGDGTTSVATSFLITVNALNDPPTISNIPDQSINEDSSTALLVFNVNDAETPAGGLSITVGTSSNALFPAGSLVMGGIGTERTLQATPAPNQSGTAVITVIVNDGSASASETFLITVNPINDPPSISNIPDFDVQAAGNTGPIPFTISDPETEAASLVVTAESSNTGLVPASAITLGGAGSARTILITPVGNTAGSATLTVRVNDGILSASDTFTVKVSVSIEAPKIVNSPAGQSLYAGDNTTLVVNATGTAPLLFQWFLNGVEIRGATEASYFIRGIQTGQAGVYTVKVSNSAGSITSPPATVAVLSLDYGDAPEQSLGGGFPTLAASNGARHGIAPNFMLGTRIDAEADGKVSLEATGDDLSGQPPSDEDGVEFLTNPLIPGQSAQLRITLTDAAKEGGKLDAFVDFNGDLAWADPAERIFNSQSLAPGANTLTFQVPKEAKQGNAFLRFRLSRKGGLSIGGLASDGEVEDYRIAIATTAPESKLDFGDAPEIQAATVGGGYPTLLSKNGARHTIVPGFFLGKSVDPELDGQPATDAKGDDNNPLSLDDEDGVEFKGPLVAGQSAQIIVTASKPGRLDAWLDFNRNKSWGDAGEQIFGSTVLVAGPNTLSFAVPASARSGGTYARFRFSTNGKLGFAGPAADGEVEDYRVSLKTQGCDLSYKGDEFWITFPGNYNPHPGSLNQLSLCIVGEPGTTGEVTFDGRIDFKQEFTIPAAMSVKINLPSAADLGEEVDVVRTKGVHVVSSDPVAVYGLNHLKHTTDGFLALPVGVIGTQYLVSGFGNLQTGVSALNGSQFAIVAAEDETKVLITPSTSLLGYAKGEPYEVLLNEGQTYQLRDPNDASADLSGTSIISDKPIALFSGHQCANVDSKSEMFCDYVVEQTLPLNAWANSYLLSPLATRSEGDNVRIIAAQNKTKVFLDGAQIADLNRGQTKKINLESAGRITSDKPILVSQLAQSSDADDVVNADPFMIQVPATKFFTKDHMICTAGSPFGAHYINVVAPTGLAIKINGNPLVAAFSPIPGTGHSWAKVSIPTGTHALEAASPFGVIVYGWGQYDSYGWPGGLFFGDLTPPTITCPDEVTVAAGTGALATTGQAACGAIVPDLRPKAEVQDNCPLPSVRVFNQSPTPGTFVGIGKHEIVITVADAAGNTSSCTTTLNVIDSGPLSIHCPSNMVVTCSKGSGAQVYYEAFASTPCGTKKAVECTPKSGSVFPLGKTEVTCVLDENGKKQTCSFFVTVVCPKISINRIDSNKGFALQWEEGMILESAPSLDGPWTPVKSQRQPLVTVPDQGQQYFRVKPRNSSSSTR